MDESIKAALKAHDAKARTGFGAQRQPVNPFMAPQWIAQYDAWRAELSDLVSGDSAAAEAIEAPIRIEGGDRDRVHEDDAVHSRLIALGVLHDRIVSLCA